MISKEKLNRIKELALELSSLTSSLSQEDEQSIMTMVTEIFNNNEE